MDFDNKKTIPLLRALIPCVEFKERRLLTLLILLAQLHEMMHTIDDLQSGVLEAFPPPEESGENVLFHALESVFSKEEMKSFSQYRQMFQAFQMMQADQPNEDFDQNFHDFPSGPSPKSPVEFFRDMLSPEQQHLVDAILTQQKDSEA